MPNQDKLFKVLYEAVSLIANAQEAQAFFEDLCTPAELEAIAGRWSVVPLLKQGIPYRTIHDQTGVSIATITRVARCIKHGSGGYDLLYQRQSKQCSK